MGDKYSFGKIHGPVNTGRPVNKGGNQIVGIGNIHISGGNRNSSGVDASVLEALDSLRVQLEKMRLTDDERNAAVEDLTRVKEAAEDKPAAAGAFESFLRRLKEANALAQTGSEFTEAVGKIARWIGPLAASAIGLL